MSLQDFYEIRILDIQIHVQPINPIILLPGSVNLLLLTPKK